MSCDGCDLLGKFRAAGFVVAVHNDYRQLGQPRTFWLLTHASGIFVKGEGSTDAEALRECLGAYRRRVDEHGIPHGVRWAG